MKRQYSIKTKILVILLILQIPLALMVILYNLYFVRFYNEQLSNANQNALASWCSGLESEFGRLDERQLNFVAMNPNFRMLASSRSILDNHIYSYDILQEYRELMENNDWLYGCYIINNNHHIFREAYSGSGDTYEQKHELRQFFGEYVQGNGNLMERSWQVLQFQGRTFLYMVKGYRETYSVYLMDAGQIPTAQEGGKGTIALLHKNHVLEGTGMPAEGGIQFQGTDHYYFSDTGQDYIVIEQAVEGSDLRAAYIMEYQGFFGSLSIAQKAVIFLSFVFVLLLIFAGCYVLQRVFFRPMDALMETMNAIKDGKLETRAPEDFLEKEFQQVNNTFNNMIGQIQQLKIDSYEKELDLRQTQLNYYQIQIRPHFYVNCLKSIYGLLEAGREVDAQSSIIYLSRHLRYMLKGSAMIVSLEEELGYVENYMELQRVSMAYPPECTTELPDEARQFQIPAISILSFVENSMKYGMDKGKPLKIGVHVSFMESEEGRYLNIHISDNGVGFAPELLKTLNQGEMAQQEGNSVGICNVMQRFWLYFGKENVLFAFSNMEGANVDIFIHLMGQKQEEKRKDEFIDRG